MHHYSKQNLRQQCHQSRRNLASHLQAQYTHRIIEQIQALPCYRNAQHIAFYHALDDEIDLNRLIDDAQRKQITAYLPRLNPDLTLSFLPVTPHTPLQLNRFHIAEPQVAIEQAQPVHAIDLMLVPLVAFDRHGTRLGRGGGYYDRTLANQRPHCLLGVAYACQCQTLIPRDPWDVPLDGLVTENQVFWFRVC